MRVEHFYLCSRNAKASIGLKRSCRRERKLRQQEGVFVRMNGLQDLENSHTCFREGAHKAWASNTKITMSQFCCLSHFPSVLTVINFTSLHCYNAHSILMQENIVCVFYSRNTKMRWVSCKSTFERKARRTGGSRATLTPSRNAMTTQRNR